MNLECKTEEQIKQYAKELFFTKGMLNASTQEIADFAGVNRTLVNYYFRSKNNLFEIVYWEIIAELREKLACIYSCNRTFREKIEKLIDYTIEFREMYPFLEVFNIQETTKMNNQLATIVQPTFIEELSDFLKEIGMEMEKGSIPKYHPKNFLINLFSLISYPIIMKPVYGKVFNISAEENEQLYKERREIVIQLLFNQVC